MDRSSNCHTAQWERQSTWLAHLREHKQKLHASGVNGFDLLEAMATVSIINLILVRRIDVRIAGMLNCIVSAVN
jgi:hypothetical protein